MYAFFILIVSKCFPKSCTNLHCKTVPGGYFEEIMGRIWTGAGLGGKARVKDYFKLLGLSDLKNGATFGRHREV